MKKFSTGIIIGLLVLLGGCATTGPAVNQAKSLPKNSEILIGEFGYWKRDCTKRHFDIYIEEYPQAGELRFEVGRLVIPNDPIVGSAGSCVGKSIQSKRVFYIPNPDFIGNDFVSYAVKSSRLMNEKVYDIDINVQ